MSTTAARARESLGEQTHLTQANALQVLLSKHKSSVALAEMMEAMIRQGAKVGRDDVVVALFQEPATNSVDDLMAVMWILFRHNVAEAMKTLLATLACNTAHGWKYLMQRLPHLLRRRDDDAIFAAAKEEMTQVCTKLLLTSPFATNRDTVLGLKECIPHFTTEELVTNAAWLRQHLFYALHRNDDIVLEIIEQLANRDGVSLAAVWDVEDQLPARPEKIRLLLRWPQLLLDGLDPMTRADFETTLYDVLDG